MCIFMYIYICLFMYIICVFFPVIFFLSEIFILEFANPSTHLSVTLVSRCPAVLMYVMSCCCTMHLFVNVGNTASHFLSLETDFPAVMGWCDRMMKRPAVLRGLRVCEWSKEYSKPWEVDKKNE